MTATNKLTTTIKFKRKTYKVVYCLMNPNVFHIGGYQRSEIGPHVENIASNFNPYALKPLFVSKRKKTEDGGGLYYLIDGQQEWRAILRLISRGELPKDFKVTVRLVVGLTYAEEADLYLLTNNNKPNTKGEKFKARLAKADDAWARLVMDTLTRHGMTYNERAGRTGPNVFPLSAIDFIEKEWGTERGGVVLFDKLLRVIRAAFGDGSGGVMDAGRYVPLLKGLALALKDADHIKEETIIARLKDKGAVAAKEEGKRDSTTNGAGQEKLYHPYFVDMLTAFRSNTGTTKYAPKGRTAAVAVAVAAVRPAA